MPADKIKTVVALVSLNATLCCIAGLLPIVGGNQQWPGARDASKEDVTDPVKAIRIVHPPEGAIEKSPVMFKTYIDLRPETDQLFETLYKDASLCIEVNDEIVHCSPLDESTFWYHHLGNCTARAYLIHSGAFDPRNRGSYPQSPSVVFTQVNDHEFDEHIAREIERVAKKHRAGYLQSLVEWADSQRRQPDEDILGRLGSISASGNEYSSDPMLVVGVRTAVVSNFPFRQAIRETWASNSVLPQGVKVIFLGCRPYANMVGEVPALRRVWESVELEKQVYGDLLTDELDCDDAYSRLADKTKEFFHIAATQFPASQYVMVADDDLYLRLDNIAAWLTRLGPLRRFYVGHVRAIQSVTKIPPNRNPASRHYLPHEQYPMLELPPFALGANFFLSMDCVEFVSKNRHRLRDLGGMDDISTALWILTMQVHPQHLIGLDHLNWGPCKDDLVALSDLSESAIRVIHANVLSKRRFCHGFEWNVWMRKNIGAPTEGQLQLLTFPREALHVQFSPRDFEEKVGHLEVTVTISTTTRAGIKVSYFPLKESIKKFVERICVKARLAFPGVADASCSKMLQSEFLAWFDELEASQLESTKLLAGWRREMQ
ncbi:hypothetical protein ON010_g11244 [Phytophthora cinnamomi]|nr:hypothetical protein ON010_g11244 [Phytophthora cinnamomi]